MTGDDVRELRSRIEDLNGRLEAIRVLYLGFMNMPQGDYNKMLLRKMGNVLGDGKKYSLSKVREKIFEMG